MGARMVPANGQTTKTKKNLLYVVLVGKTFHLITNIYICVQFLFSKRGASFYGYRASIGTYTVHAISYYTKCNQYT